MPSPEVIHIFPITPQTGNQTALEKLLFNPGQLLPVTVLTANVHKGYFKLQKTSETYYSVLSWDTFMTTQFYFKTLLAGS